MQAKEIFYFSNIISKAFSYELKILLIDLVPVAWLFLSVIGSKRNKHISDSLMSDVHARKMEVFLC